MPDGLVPFTGDAASIDGLQSIAAPNVTRIETTEQFTAVSDARAAAKAMHARVTAWFEGTENQPGPKRRAYALWKALVGQENELLAQPQRVVEACDRLLVDYEKRERERVKRLEEQDALLASISDAAEIIGRPPTQEEVATPLVRRANIPTMGVGFASTTAWAVEDWEVFAVAVGRPRVLREAAQMLRTLAQGQRRGPGQRALLEAAESLQLSSESAPKIPCEAVQPVNKVITAAARQHREHLHWPGIRVGEKRGVRG